MLMCTSVSRSHAVACVNQFIISRTQALMLHIDSFIEVRLGAAHGGLPCVVTAVYRQMVVIAGGVKVEYSSTSFS